jgi:hypothetical protein
MEAIMANANHTAHTSKINTIRLQDIELASINDLPTLAEYGYKVFVSKQNNVLTPDECEWVKLSFFCHNSQEIAQKMGLTVNAVTKLAYSITSKLCIQLSENIHRDIFFQIMLKGLGALAK